MTTPPVPVVDSIEGLRELWLEPFYQFWMLQGDGWVDMGVIVANRRRYTRQKTAAEAAQALAAALVAAGYEPKEGT